MKNIYIYLFFTLLPSSSDSYALCTSIKAPECIITDQRCEIIPASVIVISHVAVTVAAVFYHTVG